MANPKYAIGHSEMLLITTRWDDGQTLVLETAVRCYTAQEVQTLIDETTRHDCTVIGVDLYDFVAKKGQSIAEDFDVRTWLDLREDERAEEAADEFVQQRALRRGTGVYSTLNHKTQDLVVGARL